MAAVGDRVAVPLPSHYRPDLQEDREHDKPGRRHKGENGVDEQYQAVLSVDHLDGMRVDRAFASYAPRTAWRTGNE